MDYCDKCKSPGVAIWFKTKDHYLDLKGAQFDEFVQELEKLDLNVKDIDYKNIEVISPKDRIRITLIRHECGPEIISDFLGELAKAGIITIILDTLKKLIKKKSKEKKETPRYQVYVFQQFNRLELNSFDQKTILTAFKKSKSPCRKSAKDKQLKPK
ncbi:MAG: hypothetical protein PHG85_00100 [Candidatus Altiarchaeota archaeon]|nr:hypothetical protein [Candidatus Altiarchaeota archaeon]